MNNNSHRKTSLALMALMLILFMASSQELAPASAQSGGAYNLSWNTVDGGGGTSTGGAYLITGMIAQPDAAAASGGIYTLIGGFWSGVQNLMSYWIRQFLPLIRTSP